MWSWILLLVTATAVVESQRDGPFDYDLYQSVLDPELCQQQLEHMQPFEFYDASFRVPQGMLTVNFISLGEYNQCLRINQNSETSPIEGKYCMIGLTGQDSINVPLFSRSSWPKTVGWTELNVTESAKDLKKYESVISKLAQFTAPENYMTWRDGSIASPVPVSLALCIPKACSVADVLEPIADNDLVPFTYTEQYCRLPDDKPLTGADYTAMVLLSIIGFITLLSTGYDINHIFILRADPARRNKLYSSFSVYTNTNRLFTITATPGSLACLDGMRSLSILWIILGHVYSGYLQLYATNLLEFFQWFSKWQAIWLMSADVTVDTFFTMSGLLLVYTTAQKMNQKKLVRNIHWFYLHRLLRMFPLLALGVLLQASVFFRVTDGPNWVFMAPQVGYCRQNWWTTLLYVNNWVKPTQACIGQTWYLSVDMQLHIASPLLLFWVLGSRRSAWSAFTIGLVAILTANTVYCFLADFSNGIDHRLYYYFNTLIRAPPFVIGMLCGYLLSLVRGKKVQIPMQFVAGGYLLALVASSYAMYQTYPNWDSTVIRDLNYSFEKSLWSLSVCWLVFACVCGYGGPINWFLSLTLWKFTARISYAMYIFHGLIMMMHASSMATLYYYNQENIFFTFAGVTMYTVMFSIVVCVLVDAPFSTLQKMMMAGLSKAPTQVSNQQTDNLDHKKQDASIERGLQES